MPTVSEVLRDPAFRRLSTDAQLTVLRKLDDQFGALSRPAQLRVLAAPQFQPVPGTEQTGLPGIPAAPVPEMREQPGVLRSAAVGAARGAASTVAAPLKLLGRYDGGQTAMGTLVRKAGEKLEAAAQGLDASAGIETDIGAAFGSGATFLASALGSPIATAVLGVSGGIEEALSRADASGKDLTTGQRAAIAAGGAALGALEALPVGRLAGILKRGGAVLPKGLDVAALRKILYPTAREYGKSAAVGFAAEAAQEGASSVGQDVIEATYGGRAPGDIGEQFTKEASLGGLVGATFDVLMRAAGSRVGRARLRRAGIDPDALLRMDPAERAIEDPQTVTAETLPAQEQFDAANERAVGAETARVSEEAESLAVQESTGLSPEAAPTAEAARELYSRAQTLAAAQKGPFGRSELVDALEVNFNDAGVLLDMLAQEGIVDPVEVDGRTMYQAKPAVSIETAVSPESTTEDTILTSPEEAETTPEPSITPSERTGRKPQPASGASALSFIRRIGKTNFKDGTAKPGIVGEGIALYEVPVSLIETTEDPIALGREEDIEQYQEQLNESDPPALFGAYDAETGRVKLIDGHRRLEALRRAGRTTAMVAMTAGPDVRETPPPRKEVVQKPKPTEAGAEGRPKLPADLAGAKPRYRFGPKEFTLHFADDIDKAAYIAAQSKPSKRDADYVRFVADTLGVDESEVRELGQRVRTVIKGLAQRSEPGALDVPPIIPIISRRVRQKPRSAPNPKPPLVSRNEITARTPKTEPARGAAVTVAVPGEQQRYTARYVLREADDVQTSHNPFSFEPNPEYQYRNDRNYREAGNAARVVANAGEKFDPGFLVTESPTAEHGPTVIDPAGNALGGNNRAMTLKRVYAHNPRGAAEYRALLRAKAEQFGLNPEDVDRFRNPILVRERNEMPADPQREITDYNKKGAAELNPNERAVTDGRRLSDRTVEKIIARLEDAGEDGTLADALRGDNGAEIVNALVDDGVITEGEKNAYIDERDQLTTEGKARIAKALVGRLFESSEQYANTPPEMRNKLERVAPQILRVEGREGWSLTEQVREALAALEDARVHKIKNLDDLARQTTIDGRQYSNDAIALAKTLQQGPVKAAAAFRRYANDEALSREGAQASFFTPPTRDEAFADAFADRVQMRPFREYGPQSTKQEALSDLEAHYKPAKHGQPGTLYVNRPVAILLESIATNPDYGSPSIGEVLPAPIVRIAESMVGKLIKANPGVSALRDLRSQLQAALRDGGPVILVQAGPETDFGSVRSTRRHEQIHIAQKGLVDFGDIRGHIDADQFFRNPSALKAGARLMPIYGRDVELLAVETATWIAAGQYQELGLSQREARSVLLHYFDLLAKQNGEKALSVLARVHPKLRRHLREQTTKAIRRKAARVDRTSADRSRDPKGASEGRPRLQQRGAPELPGSRPGGSKGRREGVRSGVQPETQQRHTSEEVAPSLLGEFDPEGDKRRLEREQLTAGFDAPLTPEEKKRGLKPAKVVQGGLFDAEEPEQGGLFGSESGSIYLGSGLGALQPFFNRLNRSDLLNFRRLARKLKSAVLADAIDLMRPLESRIEREGAGAGRTLMRLLRKAGDRGEVQAGRRLVRLVDAKLDKLSREQRFNLLDVMEGRAKPKDAAVRDAYLAARSITDEIADEAEALQVKIRSGNARVPFRRLPNYYPHLLRGPDTLKSGPVRRDVMENLVRLGHARDKADASAMLDSYIRWVESGTREDRILDHLVRTGQAATRDDAFALLQKFRQHIKRSGNLEFARTINLPFYDPDPARVLPMHVAGASIRLAQVAELGQDNQVVNREIKRIADAGGNPDFVRRAVDNIIGWANAADEKDHRVSRWLRAIQGFKLGLAAIPNSTQGVLNGLLAADLPSVAAGLQAATRRSGWRFAIEAGATIDPILHESVRELVAGNRVLEHYLRATGFAATERANRVLAANIGAVYAQRMLGRLRVNPTHKRAQRALTELIGREATQAAIRRGSLTADDVLMAAKRFSDLTQFRSRPQDLPEFASTPWGQVFFQFKSFAYNQTRLLHRSVVRELKDGEVGRALRNLLILGTIFPVTGEAIRQLRALLTGREPKEKGFERYLAAAASVGSLGILWDTIESGRQRRGLEFLVGPTGGDIGRLIDIAGAKDKQKAAGRFLQQRTPLTGVAGRLIE